MKTHEIMLLVISFFVRHNLTKKALVDLLKLLNLILGSQILPESHFKFTKYCHKILNYTKQYFCSECQLYLGKSNEITEIKDMICPNCSNSKIKYFITNAMSSYLRDIIMNNIDSILKYSQDLKEDFLSDITKGSFIENLKKKYENFFTISFNTDGIAAFNSNIQKSLWPIIVTINELPPKLRYSKKNIIIAGLWLDNIQPPMELFLKPFCDELNNLFNEGIKIKNQIFKIICAAGCADSVARCKLVNFKQFNGKFGCTYCKHPGKLVKVNGSKQLRYLLKSISI